jgi:RHS repeat-associated protein
MNLSPRFSFVTTCGVVLALGLSLCQVSSSETPRLVRSSRAQNVRTHTGTLGQTTTLLPNGKLLLIGGESASGVVVTVAVKDPKSEVTTELKAGLLHARAWHTATLLPDGTVLVFGGVDGAKNLVPAVEIFDPVKGRSSEVLVKGLALRAHHSATLLTDGRVLIAGGIGASGEVLDSLQTWDFPSGAIQLLPTLLLSPRRDHTASLTANGNVLFWGGNSSTGLALEFGESFDPSAEVERVVTNPELFQADRAIPFVEASHPSDGATDVSLTPLIGIRFSKPLAIQSITAGTVSLGTNGTSVAAKVIPAEGGMLAFVTPAEALTASTSYTLALGGAKDTSGDEIDSVSITFTTVADSAANAVGVVLGGTNGDDGERGPLDNTAFRLPALQTHKGETALAGQVLKLNGKPLAHVLLQIEDKQAYSDGTGRFVIENVTSGHHAMVIDGSAANHGNVEYGIYDDGVDVQAGQTNVLSYPIWMTPLDRQHEVTIPSPTTSEFIVTNPSLPGLELHLPPNTVIRDRNGKVVTRLSITPVPVNQPPFPLPQGVEVPIYFTIQPGGAYLEMPAGSWGKGAQLWYPNWRSAKPGTQFDFWNYDPENKGWYVYGEGQVSSKDIHSIIPGPGVEIYQFTGAMVGSPASAPGTGGTAGDSSNGGDPVNLSSGLFVYQKTDLVLPDVIPLTLERTYRPNDNQSRPFGIGATNSYELVMVGDSSAYTYQDLVLPDGSRIHFYRTSSGTSWTDAVYAHTAAGTGWYGATIVWNTSAYPGASWILTTKNGTKYYFPEAAGQTIPGKMAVLGIQDRHGNTVAITRDTSGNVTKVTSPNGRYITFQHDTNNRMTQAQDNSGRTVLYQYDAVGRLQQVTDPAGGVWQYTYDSNNNMLTIQDARGIVYLTNEYDSGNHITKQTQADGSIYRFAWTFTSNTAQPPYFIVGSSGPPGGSASAVMAFRTCSTCSEGYNPLVTQVDVTDPNGNVKRVQFGPTGYTTSVTYALGRPEQQAYAYAYYADNLLQSVTDPLGRVTTYSYDAFGNATSTVQLSGTSSAVTTTAVYDPTNSFNQITSSTDPLNHTTNFAYDATGNLVTVTNPLGQQTTFAYNSQGQITRANDSLGNSTQFAYSSGDLVSTTDPLGRTTARTPDNIGRLLKVTDAAGNSTQFAYNTLNKTTSTTDALGNVTSFTYDANGNLLTVTDANQRATVYTYDNMDRLSTRKDPLQNQENHQYDGNGNVTQFTDRRNKIATFSYDGLNRKTFAGYGTTAGPAYESSVTYTYDSGNRLTQIADTSGGTITRGYDNLDRLTSDATPNGTVGYGYNNAGRRTSLTVPGQSVVNYTFDSANRLTQITQGSATVEFSYDAVNRRTSLTLPNGVVTSYSYDSGSQLIGIAYANGTSTLGTLTYSYDVVGRRASVGGSMAAVNLPNAVSATAYNVNNQLTTWGTANLFYDANGNMTSDGTHSYTWDARNRLAAMDSGSTANFAYDAFGRRSSKTILGAQKNFLYDGANAVQELSGSTATANMLAGGVDEVFQRTDSGGAMNLLADALGSTVGLANTTGILQTTYSYEPFGNTTATGTSSSNSTAYTGREVDATGLYFYRARYYNATLQRFISEDPIGLDGGINFYRYVGDNPVNLLDPFGLNDYSQQQTLQYFLQPAYNGATAGFFQGLLNIRDSSQGGGQYDFAHNQHAADTFAVGDLKMSAGDFGNYIAGFQGAAWDQKFHQAVPDTTFASALVEAAGIYYHLMGDTDVPNDPWDKTGMPWIKLGEAAGKLWGRKQ